MSDDMNAVTDDGTVAALMIRIMQQNANDSSYLLNGLVEGLQRDLDHAQAELTAIRKRITILLRGPYLPNPALVLNALYPAEEEINAFLPEEGS